MCRSVVDYLRHILEETRFLLDQSADLKKDDFFENPTLKRAFVRSLEIIGEAAKQIPGDFRNKYPEVESLTLISGSYDLLVQVEGRNLKEVAFFVSEKLATIKGVQSTVTHFLLKKYKEDGVIFVDQPESKRLPVAP